MHEPSSVEATVAREIAAPVAEVATLALDPAQFQYWRDDYHCLDSEEPPQVSVGNRYTLVTHYRPHQDTTMVVTGLAPGSITVQSTEHRGECVATLTLAPLSGERTLVTYAMRVEEARHAHLSQAVLIATLDLDLTTLSRLYEHPDEDPVPPVVSLEDGMGETSF